MPVWPTTLPQCPLRSKTRSPKSNVIAFGTEVGPGKLRRRSTARGQLMSMKFRITTAQVAIFENFFQDSLSDGALSYTWPDPVTGASASWRFDPSGPYSLNETAAPGKWELSIQIEKLP